MVSNHGDGGGDGRIIWISSIQGLIGTPFRTSYAASKFAVQGYCEALRSELTSSGVSVHVVSPGYIRTNLSLSAVCGDGSKYGNTYATTAKGADPDKVAVQILDSVAKGCQDFVVAASPSSRIALWIKNFSPPLLREVVGETIQKEFSFSSVTLDTLRMAIPGYNICALVIDNAQPGVMVLLYFINI